MDASFVKGKTLQCENHTAYTIQNWRSRRQLIPWGSEQSTIYFFFLARKGKSDDDPFVMSQTAPTPFPPLVTTPPAQVLAPTAERGKLLMSF